MKAYNIVADTIAAMTGPIPVSHLAIVSARFENKHHITADLLMFDQRPATVDLKRWAFGWSVRYSNLPGGNIMWTGSQWERDLDASVDHG